MSEPDLFDANVVCLIIGGIGWLAAVLLGLGFMAEKEEARCGRESRAYHHRVISETEDERDEARRAARYAVQRLRDVSRVGPDNLIGPEGEAREYFEDCCVNWPWVRPGQGEENDA